jgi:hypothetical protein
MDFKTRVNFCYTEAYASNHRGDISTKFGIEEYHMHRTSITNIEVCQRLMDRIVDPYFVLLPEL